APALLTGGPVMTAEATTFVYIDQDDWASAFAPMADQAQRCVLRQAKAAPGDRQEATRYDVLCRQMERLARLRLQAGAPDVVLDPAHVTLLDAGTPLSRHAWLSSL